MKIGILILYNLVYRCSKKFIWSIKAIMDRIEDILKTIYLFSKFNEKELSLLAAKIKKVDLNIHGVLLTKVVRLLLCMS